MKRDGVDYNINKNRLSNLIYNVVLLLPLDPIQNIVHKDSLISLRQLTVRDKSS